MLFVVTLGEIEFGAFATSLVRECWQVEWLRQPGPGLCHDADFLPTVNSNVLSNAEHLLWDVSESGKHVLTVASLSNFSADTGVEEQLGFCFNLTNC